MTNLKDEKNKYISLVILLGFSGIIALTRLHTFNEPIDRDLATYAVIAHEMLKGRSLYSDLWDHKPPAIHVTFAIAEKLVGYGQGELYFLGVVASLLTLFGVYRAGSSCGFGLMGGFWAVAIWTIISPDMLLQANQPNSEVFINAVLIWAFALLVLQKPKASQTNLAGILLAIGSLYKPQITVFSLLFPAVFFFFDKGKTRILNTFKISLRLFIPVLAAWFGCCLYFVVTHRFNDFYDAVFAFNRFYGGNLDSNLLNSFRPEHLIPRFIWFLTPAALLILMGFFLSFRQLTKPWFFLAAYIVGTYISVALPGRFFQHYYQLWLPVFSVGGGWGIVVTGKHLKSFTNSLYLIPGILCLVVLALYEVPNYLLDANSWSFEKYGSMFIKDRQLAEMLARNSKPGQSFIMLGQEPNLYFYSRESPPTGLVYTTPTIWGPLQPYLSKRLLTDMTRQKPDILVFYKLNWTEEMIPLKNVYHFLRSYPQDGDFKIYVAGNIILNK